MVLQHSPILSDEIAVCVARFREKRPHVHCITNSVAQHFTANVLLAAGATPSMTIAVDEVSSFVGMADALLVNLGTMDIERSQSITLAIDKAKDTGKPWALDPVFVHGSPLRLEMAQTLLERSPAVVRCNEREGEALFGGPFGETRLSDVAATHRTTLAVTGETDRVATANGRANIANGSRLMDRVTAMGCALSALTAGFLASEDDPLLATSSAVALFGLAGERAGLTCQGPGTFVPLFLDSLANLKAEDLRAGIIVS